MGWDWRNLITTGTQGRAVEWREGSSRKCLRRAKRSIWPKVLWAQCPLAELFICLRRWPCNVVILPSSNAAQRASRKLVQQFRVAFSWEKVTKSQGKRQGPYSLEVCISPDAYSSGRFHFISANKFFFSNMVPRLMRQFLRIRGKLQGEKILWTYASKLWLVETAL